MFGNGEAPPTASVSTIPKAFGPIVGLLWSKRPRTGPAPAPPRPVPTSGDYPRPTRSGTSGIGGVFDLVVSMPTRTEFRYLAVGFVVGVFGTLAVGAVRRHGR